MKLLWVAQITKKNSFSKVSMDYIEMIRNFSNWELRLFDISNDIPEMYLFNTIIDFQPDFVIILHNDSDLRDITRRLLTIRSKWNGKLIAFMPVDYFNPKKNVLNINCKYFWTMNEWAANQLSKFNSEIRVGVLEHIVEDFYQFSDKKRISMKKKYYGHFSDRFIVGMVNANNTRKRLDLGIEAFRRFNKRVPYSLLVIKTTPPELKFSGKVYEDWSSFIDKLPVLIFEHRFSDFELNELYNSFDLMINPTDGEGFGLTSFEAALSGTLSILPLHTSFLSLLPKGDSSRYCINVDFVPCEYARYAVDYLRYRSGEDKLSFLYGLKDGLGGVRDSLPKISNMNAEIDYVVSVIEKHGKSLEEVVNSIRIDKPNSFQVFITSDIESLRYYLGWCLNNQSVDVIDRRSGSQPSSNDLSSTHQQPSSNHPFNLLLGSDYSLIATSLDSIESYIGLDQAKVGIIDPEEMSDKIYYYYKNQEDKYKDMVKFQQYVKDKFNSKRIFDQLTSLLANLLTKEF